VIQLAAQILKRGNCGLNHLAMRPFTQPGATTAKQANRKIYEPENKPVHVFRGEHIWPDIVIPPPMRHGLSDDLDYISEFPRVQKDLRGQQQG
jgi:hypothetical protein